MSRHVRESKTVLDSRFHTVDSGLQVLDSEFFVSGTLILDSNRLWDSGFLKLYSGFQSPGFRILQLKKLLGYGIRTPLHGAKHDSFSCLSDYIKAALQHLPLDLLSL